MRSRGTVVSCASENVIPVCGTAWGWDDRGLLGFGRISIGVKIKIVGTRLVDVRMLKKTLFCHSLNNTLKDSNLGKRNA